MNFEQVRGGIERNRSDMLGLQNQAATMKRVTKPSDDPVGTSRILGIRTSRATGDQLIKNLEVARTFMNYSDTALSELTEVLTKAKTLAISQASDASSNATSRFSTATEVDQMVGDLVNIGNRKFGDRFIFGGFKTTNAPFTPEGKYVGDDGSIRVEVNRGVFTAMNVPGNRIFMGEDIAFRVAKGKLELKPG
jgi:flagellar hook-associated protein 3 FlgL